MPIAPGTQTLPLAAAVAALPAVECHAVILQADIDNNARVIIGGPAIQTITLTAGQSMTISAIDNLNELWAYGSVAGEVLNWIGMQYRRR